MTSWKTWAGLIVALAGTVGPLYGQHVKDVVPLFGPHEPESVRSNVGETAVVFESLEQTPVSIDPFACSPEIADRPWWTDHAAAHTRPGAEPLPVTIESLILRAVNHSAQIRVFSDLPLIRETSIVEAQAAFDWAAYLDSRWDDLNDPVGSSLTVGGTGNRFEDHNLNGAAGLRKRTTSGGQFEAAQRFGFQDTNSRFFIPDPQGTSRLSLSYTHPLMRGRGKIYNESITLLAKIDTGIAHEEFSRQLQSHLLEVVRSYWGLYRERANYAQKKRSYERAEVTFVRLKQRARIDAVKAQILRAEAEVATRKAELIRAELAVKNAESRIRSLVNDPSLGTFETVELLTVDEPTRHAVPVDMQYALTTAMQKRPEINQALEQIKAAAVRAQMSKHELMPVLNLVTEAYVAGLENNGSAGDAFQDQFTEGRPGYSIGLNFEVPLGNRAACARRTRRLLELRQVKNQYETTVETLKLEVEVSVREVQTAFNEICAQARAVEAGEVQLDYLQNRWRRLPGEDGTASLVLENLLTAQSRLAQSESAFLQAAVTYNLALINLKRSTGELLEHEQISVGRGSLDGVPLQVVDKPEAAYTAPPAGLPIEDFDPRGTVPAPRPVPEPESRPAYDDSLPADDGGVVRAPDADGIAPVRYQPANDQRQN